MVWDGLKGKRIKGNYKDGMSITNGESEDSEARRVYLVSLVQLNQRNQKDQMNQIPLRTAKWFRISIHFRPIRVEVQGHAFKPTGLVYRSSEEFERLAGES